MTKSHERREEPIEKSKRQEWREEHVEKSKRLEWRVKPTEKGKLIAFLVLKFPEASQRQIRRSLDARCCEVNGHVERFANTKLRPNDLVVFHGDLRNYEKRESISFDNKNIIFEDDHILAFNKPRGVSSDSAGVLKLLAPYHSDLRLVHRLDKQTSGVLILAKDEETQKAIEELFRERSVKKIYLALVEGVPKEKKGKIDNFMGKLRSYGHGQQLWGVVEEGGRRAITEWKVKEERENGTLLVCVPLTGRTHQIRVHLAHIGHPIVGDLQYGTKSKQSSDHHLLHAWKISISIWGEEKTFVAPIPEDMC